MKNDKVFKINPAAAPRGFRNPVSRFLVEHAVGFPKLDRIVTQARALQRSGEEPDFNAAILKGMNLHVELDEADLANIPKEGPVILVSNHPFGGIEGVVLLDILRRARPDFKVMANYYLDAIPEMRKDFIFVNPFGSAAAAKQNIRPLLECVRWLKDGHILGVFPSGEVSSIDLKRRLVRDPPWSETIAGLARKTGATVVPMHFCGRNPALFQLAGLVHPRLRTVLLPRMTARQRRRTITAFIGKPVTPGEIARVESDKELTRLFRLRSYALEGRAPARKKLLRLPRRKPAALAGPREEIISETPREQVEAALAALPKDAFLLSGSGLDVYMASLSPENPIMREIGRLREITFRAVGEGTGRATDVDVYDPHYRHLFLWDPKERRLVGAYRLGLAPEAAAAAIRGFEPLPHRMQRVAEGRGAVWIDNSKATSLAAMLASVRMAPKPALLVAGGRIKEDLSVRGVELASLGVAKAYTIGECGEAMARAWGGALPVEFAGDLGRACEAAARDVDALRPACVLLAPGTASFDQFRSFEERGDRFAALARRLADGPATA